MTATFDPTLPTDRDRLRFLIGDTSVAVAEDVLIADEVYDAEIARSTDWRIAGIVIASGVRARFALEPDTISITGEGSFSWRERIKTLDALIAEWTAQIASESSSGGVTSGFRSVGPTREGIVEAEYVRSPYS